MITGGNATVFISNMDAAVAFYTGVLGLKLSSRYEDHWATVEAGAFTIGLHPISERSPKPGTKGAMQVGLTVDGPIETMEARLKEKGTKMLSEVVRGGAGNFVNFEDPDGNELYLWETTL